jgi:hypothetical protein
VLSLNGLSLVLELISGNSVIIVFAIIIALGVTLGDVALAAITSLITVSEARDGADSHVLSSEVLVLKVIENLTIVHVGILTLILTGSLHDLIKLRDDNCVHTLEDLDDISAGLDCSIGPLDKSREFGVDLLGPAGDLVVDDIDLLEFFLEERIVFLDILECLIKLHDFLIHHAIARAVLTSVNLELMESATKLLIVSL